MDIKEALNVLYILARRAPVEAEAHEHGMRAYKVLHEFTQKQSEGKDDGIDANDS